MTQLQHLQRQLTVNNCFLVFFLSPLIQRLLCIYATKLLNLTAQCCRSYTKHFIIHASSRKKPCSIKLMIVHTAKISSAPQLIEILFFFICLLQLLYFYYDFFLLFSRNSRESKNYMQLEVAHESKHAIWKLKSGSSLFNSHFFLLTFTTLNRQSITNIFGCELAAFLCFLLKSFSFSLFNRHQFAQVNYAVSLRTCLLQDSIISSSTTFFLSFP